MSVEALIPGYPDGTKYIRDEIFPSNCYCSDCRSLHNDRGDMQLKILEWDQTVYQESMAALDRGGYCSRCGKSLCEHFSADRTKHVCREEDIKYRRHLERLDASPQYDAECRGLL